MAGARQFKSKFEIGKIFCLPYSGNIVVLDKRYQNLELYDPTEFRLIGSYNFKAGQIEDIKERSDLRIYCTFGKFDNTTLVLAVDSRTNQLCEAREKLPFVYQCQYDDHHVLGLVADRATHKLNLYHVEGQEFKELSTLMSKDRINSEIRHVLITLAKKILVMTGFCGGEKLEQLECKSPAAHQFTCTSLPRLDIEGSQFTNKNVNLVELADGRILFSVQRSTTTCDAIIYDLKPHAEERAEIPEGGNKFPLTKLLLSPNGVTVIGRADNGILLIDTVTKRSTWRNNPHISYDMAISQGRLLISAGDCVSVCNLEEPAYVERRSRSIPEINSALAPLLNLPPLRRLVMAYSFFFHNESDIATALTPAAKLLTR